MYINNNIKFIFQSDFIWACVYLEEKLSFTYYEGVRTLRGDNCIIINFKNKTFVTDLDSIPYYETDNLKIITNVNDFINIMLKLKLNILIENE